MAEKVWFITGTSRGFGRTWAEAALERGDKVAATARDTATLSALVEKYGDAVLPLRLDVTDRAADFEAVRQAHEHFGRLDIVINNAGYGFFSAIEEATESEVRAQLETNLFGAIWVTQAALPYLRQQGSGHIIQVSSIGGVAAFPTIGFYHASKWGLEGFSEALAQEVAEFGIEVTIVEPGGFDTDWGGSSSVHAEHNPVYDGVRERLYARFASAGRQGSTPATAAAILALVDAEKPPLRLLLGAAPTEMVKQVYASRLATWAEWDAVSKAAQG